MTITLSLNTVSIVVETFNDLLVIDANSGVTVCSFDQLTGIWIVGDLHYMGGNYDGQGEAPLFPQLRY